MRRVAERTPLPVRVAILVACLGAAAANGREASASARALVDTSRSPAARMSMVALGDVRWDGGLMGERFEVCRRTMVPHMGKVLRSEKDSHAWANILLAAGVSPGRDGRHHGPPFNDGDFLKWFESVAQVYAVTRDPELDALMDEMIEVLARAQREDGYLHTPVIIAQRRGDAGAREFADRNHFETYNMGHLMTAACVHARATGKDKLLTVARRAADFLYGFYKRSSPDLARSAVCPSHYMGIVELYRATGEARYLELARQLIEIRDLVQGGTDQNQDRVPFRQMTKAVGHAVRANYLYAGVADVVAETGDATLLEPLTAIGEDVASHKLYLTGATGALYDGASPDGSGDHSSVQLVHQAYGRDHQLPNLSAYNESCATVGYVLWNWRMLVLTGEARYADRLEQALLNGVLAAISLDGREYFYVNPLRKLHAMTWPLRWSRTRQPNIPSSFCCPPNVVRTIAEAQNYAYALSKDTLWVHLYGGSVLDTGWSKGGRIRLRQESDYPWSGAVRLVIEAAPARPIALKLRIPGWLRPGEAGLRVNGRPFETSLTPGTYAEVRQVWRANDRVELDLKLVARLWEADPLVEEALGQVAVKYGPLVYCLESSDLPTGVRIEDIALSLDDAPRRFQAKRETIAGAELLTLSTPALEIQRDPRAPGQLYREASAARPRRIAIKLVPYYAWGNRGDTEMTVWLPVRGPSMSGDHE